MPNPARIYAIEILKEVDKGQSDLTDLLNDREKDFKDPRDAGLMRALVYGTLEHLFHLDHIINRLSKKPIASQKPIVRAIVRQGAFELWFLHTPSHAAIHEAVELAKIKAPYARAYVNGLFRTMVREGSEILTVNTGDPLEDLSILSSHPRWVIDLLLASYRLDEVKEILKRNNQPAPLVLFVCPPFSREEAKKTLEKEGISGITLSRLESHSLLTQGGPITESRLFQEGKITIASQPSALAGGFAVEGLGKDARILDLCAAPGSKTAVMSLLSGAKIFANDKSEEKMIRLKENIQRLHLHTIDLFHLDGTIQKPEWIESFDLVLLDAPCSGLGLMGRKPDIRYHRKPADLLDLQVLQKQLLKNAQSYVRPGGRLVYSTCTYGKRENEEVIQTLPPSFQKEPLQEGLFKGKNQIHFSPLLEGSDGFFVSRFRKDQ